MIQHLVCEIGGVAMLGVISVCLFFVVFGGAMIFALCMKKPFLVEMGSKPLGDAEIEAAKKGESHHG